MLELEGMVGGVRLVFTVEEGVIEWEWKDEKGVLGLGL